MVYNAERGTLAFAASDVRYGMESFRRAGANSTRHDIGGPNDIRLEYNACGCVYEVSKQKLVVKKCRPTAVQRDLASPARFSPA